MTSYDWRKKVEFKLQLMAFRNKNILPCLTCQYDRGQCTHARSSFEYTSENCLFKNELQKRRWSCDPVLNCSPSVHALDSTAERLHSTRQTDRFFGDDSKLEFKGCGLRRSCRVSSIRRGTFYILHFTTQRPEFERLKPTLAILHWLTTFKTFFHVMFFLQNLCFLFQRVARVFTSENVRLVLFNSCESFVWDAIAAPGDRNKGVK